MTLDELGFVVRDLENRMGKACPRSELLAIIADLWRKLSGRVTRGELWSSLHAQVENDLFIPDGDPIPAEDMNRIISQLLRQDYPAWRRYLGGHEHDGREEYDYGRGNGGTVN